MRDEDTARISQAGLNPQTEAREVNNIVARTDYLDALQILSEMRTRDREILELTAQDYSIVQIAEHYQINYQAAKVRLHRARARFKQRHLFYLETKPI